jgi:Skp family chaperone for outer membrane proteins
MKFYKSIKTLVLVWLMAAFVMACSSETRHSANREFDEFSAWVDSTSLRAETATEEEWNEMQAEYNRRATELEKRKADWDDKSKAEWEEVQTRWQETVGKAEARFRASEEDMDADTTEKF